MLLLLCYFVLFCFLLERGVLICASSFFAFRFVRLVVVVGGGGVGVGVVLMLFVLFVLGERGCACVEGGGLILSSLFCFLRSLLCSTQNTPQNSRSWCLNPPV